MAVIAVYSVKGGVGKTTISANLAWSSATTSRRHTLLWDLDPAGGAAFLFGLDDPDKARAERLFDLRWAPDKLVQPSGYDRLDILPSDSSLRTLDNQLAAIGKKKRLAKIAEELSQRYERIILDCPPVLNEVSAQVIRAADIVIVPLPPSPLARRALEMIRKDLADNHKKHPPILPVLSMYDARRRLHKEMRAGEAKGWPLIPMASVVEQGAERQQPVGSFAATSPAANCFGRLWTAIERKLVQLKKDKG